MLCLGGLVVTGEFAVRGPVAWVAGLIVCIAVLIQWSQIMTAPETRIARRWQGLHAAQVSSQG